MTSTPQADPDAFPAEHVLRALPKVELHTHLEGSIDASTARDLAARHGLNPDRVSPGLAAGRYPARFRGLSHFVETYVAVSGLLRRPEDLADVAATFARGQARQGIRYTEVTFTACTHARNGMEASAMWQALREGLDVAAPATRVGVIVDVPRDLPEETDPTIALVEAADAPIVGLGLSGTENAHPESDFVALRDAADRLGLGLSVHAGETGGPDNVWQALDVLGADRIGHGIAACDDDALLDRLAADGVVLEVCPSSNVALDLVSSIEEHPFTSLWQAGIAVTVNSDDGAFFSTTLTDELRHVTVTADLDIGDIATLQRRAAGAAFAPADLRRRLAGEIDAWEVVSAH